MKIIERAAFRAGDEIMKVCLQQGARKWSVHVTVKDGAGKIVTSGYTGVDVVEKPIRDCYAWTLAEALKKGWSRAKRGGLRLAILPGVPEPRGLAAAHPIGPAPVAAKRGRPRKALP